MGKEVLGAHEQPRSYGVIAGMDWFVWLEHYNR